jgi:hypothetical protein
VAPVNSDRAAHHLCDVPQQPAATGAGAAAALQLRSDAARSALPRRAGVPRHVGPVVEFDVRGDLPGRGADDLAHADRARTRGARDALPDRAGVLGGALKSLSLTYAQIAPTIGHLD